MTGVTTGFLSVIFGPSYSPQGDDDTGAMLTMTLASCPLSKTLGIVLLTGGTVMTVASLSVASNSSNKS